MATSGAGGLPAERNRGVGTISQNRRVQSQQNKGSEEAGRDGDSGAPSFECGSDGRASLRVASGYIWSLGRTMTIVPAGCCDGAWELSWASLDAAQAADYEEREHYDRPDQVQRASDGDSYDSER